MRFSVISAALGLLGVAAAQTDGFDPITKPLTDEVVPAGSTYTITWNSTRTGTVSLQLIGGATQGTQVPLGTIAAGISSSDGQFAWAVDSSLGSAAVYGIQLFLDSDNTIFQYSNPFHISASGSSSGGGYSASSSTSGSTAPTSSAPKSTTAYTTSAAPSSSTKASYSANTTPSGSASTTASPTTSSGTLYTTTTATRTTSTAPSVSTAAAPRYVAGSMALVGGIAAAAFAL